MNRQQQGKRGEACARFWYEMDGWDVYIPTSHTSDADFIALKEGRTVRVQVKTSGYASRYGIWNVAICTRGLNQSWSGLVKRFSAERCDELFAVTVDGRRWRIPAGAVRGTTTINLGGAGYAEFEVDPGPPLADPKPPLSLLSSTPAG